MTPKGPATLGAELALLAGAFADYAREHDDEGALAAGHILTAVSVQLANDNPTALRELHKIARGLLVGTIAEGRQRFAEDTSGRIRGNAPGFRRCVETLRASVDLNSTERARAVATACALQLRGLPGVTLLAGMCARCERADLDALATKFAPAIDAGLASGESLEDTIETALRAAGVPARALKFCWPKKKK